LSGAPLLGKAALRTLPDPAATPEGCACAHLRCTGWESVGAPLAPPLVRRLGTLVDPDDPDPTVEEVPGSRYWAADTPIDPAYFPVNRCTVWACVSCGRGFLQYTEYGGYYIDHRLRQVDPALVAPD
jgi:hypothetical protein